MSFKIIHGDIIKLRVDGIVNAANTRLSGGGGVDGAIHDAAGPKLIHACSKLNGCGIGEAKITEGYNLPAKYIIHTVGPIWNGGISDEEEILMSAYKNSLLLAEKFGLKSVAFPLISAGAFGFPKHLALEIAIKSLEDYLITKDMIIYLVIYDSEIINKYEGEIEYNNRIYIIEDTPKDIV